MKNDVLYGLTRQGYNGYKEFDPSEFDMDRINAIRAIIKPRLEKTKSINSRAHSYTLKMRCEHQIEAAREPLCGYVGNGELIYAMILEGFKVKQEDLNASFNVSNASLKRLPRHPEYTLNGDVYEGDNRNFPRWKPVFKVNAEQYRDIFTAEHPRITIIDRYE